MSTTTDFFPSNGCAIPPIRTNVATSGLVTACDAYIPTPAELDTMYQNGGDWTLMSALFEWQWEAAANQAEQSNLFKFFMASKANMNKRLSVDKRPGFHDIRPYVLVKRKGIINNNFWKAKAGAAALIDGTLDAAGTYWNLTVASLTGIPAHAGFFQAPYWVYVRSVADDGTSIVWAGQIVTSVVVGSNVVVTLKPQMNNSALPAARKANPVDGILTRGGPNVTDYESLCAQPPGLISNEVDPYWLGWTRWNFKEDELYNRWRDLVLADNQQYREIYDLPTQEYNKQVSEDFARMQVEMMFNNTALANQSISTLANMETISTSVDSVGGARCIGKRANPIGIYEQHVQCERVVDAQGAKLNLPALFQALNKMKRIREATGAAAAARTTFEIATPSTYAVLFHQAMLRYYQVNWPGVQWSVEVNPNMTRTAPMGFRYKEYPLVWPDGVTIRVITDNYFDDYAAFCAAMAVDADIADANYANLGRRLWIADWSRIFLGIVESNRYAMKPGSQWNQGQNLGINDPCTPRSVQESIVHTTFGWTVVADAILGNLIIENLSAELPEHDVIGAVNYDENS